jgi:hypothetical protein
MGDVGAVEGKSLELDGIGSGPVCWTQPGSALTAAMVTRTAAAVLRIAAGLDVFLRDRGLACGLALPVRRTHGEMVTVEGVILYPRVLFHHPGV